MLTFFKEILKNFDSSRKTWIFSKLSAAGIVELFIAAIMTCFCFPMFLVACLCTSGLMLSAIAGAIHVTPASGGSRQTRWAAESKCIQINMCPEVLRPRAHSHARRRRSATRSSFTAGGGNADDGDGSSDSSDLSSIFRHNSNFYLKHFQKAKTNSDDFPPPRPLKEHVWSGVPSPSSTWEVAL